MLETKDPEQLGDDKYLKTKDDLPTKEVALADFVPEWEPTLKQKKRVLRKIDCLLIPLMCGCVLCKCLSI